MIYTVTFNPSLDYVVQADQLIPGEINRTTSEHIYPGGKGNNVSVILSNLGLKSKALGFKAGFTGDVLEKMLEAQYTGDNLYDVIQKICEEQGIGFKITLNDEKQFVFELYAGSDRSYDQTRNPYVIFSPKFENIINSNYIESKASLKTVTLVGGEGEGADRRYTTVGGGSGLNRRELFTDARDISSNVGSDDALTDAEYMAQLQQRGKEKLAENVSITSFEGETETTIMFQYGKDFFNGDIVQIANEYGHETKARILEIVRSEDKDGYSVYPTFKTIEQEGA